MICLFVKWKKLDRYRGEIHGVSMREIPCYLKGQLSKNLTIYSSVISGIDRLEEAFKILDEKIGM